MLPHEILFLIKDYCDDWNSCKAMCEILKIKPGYDEIFIKKHGKSYDYGCGGCWVSDEIKYSVSSFGNRWYKNDKLHRECDLPAWVRPNGSKFWYIEGRLHRDDDKPAIIHPDGHMKWLKHGNKYNEKWFKK